MMTPQQLWAKHITFLLMQFLNSPQQDSIGSWGMLSRSLPAFLELKAGMGKQRSILKHRSSSWSHTGHCRNLNLLLQEKHERYSPRLTTQPLQQKERCIMELISKPACEILSSTFSIWCQSALKALGGLADKGPNWPHLSKEAKIWNTWLP